MDYTIAVAERSLAKSVKRCMGKSTLAKAAKLDRTRRLELFSTACGASEEQLGPPAGDAAGAKSYYRCYEP